MKTFLAAIGGLALLLAFALFALCNDDGNDPNSFATVQTASHEYGGGGYDEECWGE